MIRRRILPFVVMGMFVLSLASPAPASSVADTAREWDFDVYVGDRKIGTHQFRVTEQRGVREVRSEAKFRYRFLFIPAFRYDHSAAERWSDNCLLELQATTRTNGERLQVFGERTPNGFLVDNADETKQLPDCVMTFAYWNPEFLDQQRLLNPQTGEFVDVSVENAGTEFVEVRGEAVEATRYEVTTNDVELTLWYSADNVWLGLQSSTKNGRTIRYELS